VKVSQPIIVNMVWKVNQGQFLDQGGVRPTVLNTFLKSKDMTKTNTNGSVRSCLVMVLRIAAVGDSVGRKANTKHLGFCFVLIVFSWSKRFIAYSQ